MSDEKDDLKSIKVYKFDNTKENGMSLHLSSELLLTPEVRKHKAEAHGLDCFHGEETS